MKKDREKDGQIINFKTTNDMWKDIFELAKASGFKYDTEE